MGWSVLKPDPHAGAEHAHVYYFTNPCSSLTERVRILRLDVTLGLLTLNLGLTPLCSRTRGILTPGGV